MDQSMMQDDATEGTEPAQTSGTVTVCIEVTDGQYSVGIEPEGSDSGMSESDPAEIEQDKSYMTPAKSLEDALTMAREMLTASEESPEAQAQAGYDKAGAKATPAKASPRAVFGESM